MRAGFPPQLAALLALALFALGFGVAGFVSFDLITRSNEDAPVRLAAPQTVLLDGDSAARAAQSLQLRLRAAARSAGVTIDRVEIRPGQGVNTVHAVLLTAEGSHSAMMTFLHDIESGVPAIMVFEADLTRQDDGRLSLEAEFQGWPSAAGSAL